MLKKIYQNDQYVNNYIRFVADTEAEISKIKVTASNMGSEVYAIDTQETYILDSACVWHSKKVGGGTIDCDCVEESTIWEDLPTEEA